MGHTLSTILFRQILSSNPATATNDEAHLGSDWRLLASFEAAHGIIIFGWTNTHVATSALERFRGRLTEELFVVVRELPEMAETVVLRDLFDQSRRRIGLAQRTVNPVEPLSLQESERGHSGLLLECVTQRTLADA